MKANFFKIGVDLIVFSLGAVSLLAPLLFQGINAPIFSQSSFPIVVSGIIILCIAIVFVEAQSSLLDSKMIAFLGILIAINSSLRFLENAIPGPAGFSPVFILIILTGYFFGSRIGFLMGALSMLISGLFTGGVGPWLPGQMITAGWVGQSSAWLRKPIQKMRWSGSAVERIFLCVHGAFWGILFGVIMNLWFWPFIGASSGQTWLKNASVVVNLQRYGAYYFATSFLWDITRAIGNVLLIALLTQPVLKIFDRFNHRFSFTIAETER